MAWDANSEPDLAGYRIFWGTQSANYGPPQNTGLSTSYTLTGLTAGLTYYIAVKAFDSSNNESGFSNEVSGVAIEPGSVTVDTNPSGLQIVVDGTTYTAPRTFSWAVGSTHTLSVPSPQPGPAGTRYVFSSWSDGAAPSRTITAPSSTASYAANFAVQYSLAATAAPTAGGTVSPAGTTWYNSGQTVSVSASPSSGYSFANWSGSLTGTANPASLVMNSAKTVSANFASPGVLSVTPAGTFSSSGAQGGPFNPASQAFTLQNTGGTSLSWSASKGRNWLTLSSSSGTLAPGASAAVTASINGNAGALAAGSYTDTINFANTTSGNGNTNRSVSLSVTAGTFSYTVSTSPSGLQITVDGTSYIAPRTFQWTPGSTHTLSVAATQGGTNGVRHIFQSWSDGGAASHTVTAPSEAYAYNAAFLTQYSLAASASPENGGTVNPAGVTWHDRGKAVSLTAISNSGFSFQHWQGDVSGSQNPQSLVMDGPKAVSSVFLSRNMALHPSPGLFNRGAWKFDANGNGLWDGCDIDVCVDGFGREKEDIPLLGDWTGDGTVKLGIYRKGAWQLDLNGNGLVENCATDTCHTFGGAREDRPVVGDWTGDGTAKIGVYRNGRWYLDANGNGALDNCLADICIDYFGGNRGDLPVVGDWTGDGTDKVGIYRNGIWILDKNGDGVQGTCDVDLCFTRFGGYRGDLPVVGDWNGDGKDKIGVYRMGQWLLDWNGNGIWEGCAVDLCIESFGGARGDVPVVARHPKP